MYKQLILTIVLAAGVLCLALLFMGVQAKPEVKPVATETVPEGTVYTDATGWHTIDTSTWVTLESPELGLQMRVPQEIIVHQNLDEPAGCAQQLILGTPDRSIIFLMPEFYSCDLPSSTNRAMFSWEDPQAKKIQIIPAQNEQEIAGIIKAKLADNQGRNDVDTQCQLKSLSVSMDSIVAEAGKTVPVRITTDTGCPIDLDLLSVRFSPDLKKVILIESVFGSFSPYYLPAVGDVDPVRVNEAIFGSIKLWQ